MRTLEILKKRGYNLGIIANQIAGTEERLESFGLLKYFDAIATSAEFGIAKPDKAIFEKALEMADCKAENSVMVGDRLDNDIRPAKAIGMKTVWIRQGLAAHQHTDLGKNVSDRIVNTLSELEEIFK